MAASRGLDEVQKRRGRATIVIQRMQTAIQQQVVAKALSKKGFDLPWFVKLILRTPGLRTIPARIFALGPRRVRLEP